MADGLRISKAHRLAMRAHVLRCLPEEACGLAAGLAGRVERILPVTNMLHSPVRFLMEPKEQLEAMIWLEENQMEMTAIYHSHPLGPPFPSQTDLTEFSYPGVATLIWSPAGVSWQARAFQIEQGKYCEINILWMEPREE